MPSARKIAIVDDDESVRSGISSLVRSLGYKAAAFGAASDLLGQDLTVFSCVISDIQMPQMVGFRPQRELAGVAPGLQRIFLTAYPDETARNTVIQAGAVCLLEKPRDPLDLIAGLETALDRHQG